MKNGKGFKTIFGLTIILKTMLKVCIIFLGVGISQIAIAQELSIQGRVLDMKNIPIQYASVKLYGAQDVLTYMGATDSLGIFKINGKSGKYKLRIEQFGTMLSDKVIELNQDSVLGDIYIDNTKQLETVVIEKKLPLLERKVDRLVFNVDRSAAASGGSALEALSITPLVKVDEGGGIGIVGKGSVSVMVNERIVHMSGTELSNYLRSLRSDDIARIEVLTVPPAKYEVQGNSGMINIQLKRSTKSGFDGYVSSRALQNSYLGIAEFLGLNYSNENLVTTFKASYFNDRNRAAENFQNLGHYSSFGHTRRKDSYKGLGLNFGVDYKLGKNSKIGLIYNLGMDNDQKAITEHNRYESDEVMTNSMDTESQHGRKTPSHTLNLYYDLNLGKQGDKLSFSTNYYARSPRNKVNLYTVDSITDSVSDVYNDSEVRYRIWSTQGDLVLPRSFAKLEMGLKYTRFKNNSSVGYFNRIGSELVIDASRSNLFDYSEVNYATYVSASRNLGDLWSLQLGLRYEYSRVDGLSISTGNRNVSNYGKLFPNAFINYKPSADHSFTLSYSERIDRPGFRELDPFRWYSTPNNYSTGNPQLRPSYSHNFELSYLLKGRFSSSLYYQLTLDGYKQVSRLNKIDQVSIYENFFDRNTYGLNLTYADKLLPWWESNNAVDLSYSTSRVHLAEMLAQSGAGASFSTSNTMSLNKDKTYFILTNYWMNLPSKRGNSISRSRGAFQIGVKSFLFEKKLTASLVANDVFKQLKGKGDNYFQDNLQSFNNYYDARNVTLSLVYKFGKKTNKNKVKNVDFKEVSRAD